MFTLANIFSYIMGRSRMIPSVNPNFIHATTSWTPGQLIDVVKVIIPPLTQEVHKGMMGRIGVVGGCQEYTGAPYFAGISALKLGADLSHIFCSKDSASVIKSYSPELIVHPILDHDEVVSQIKDWLPRLHVVVLGPGLGTSDKLITNAKVVLELVRQRGIPVVIDADGLHVVTQYPEVIKNYKKAILTPNVVEFGRLYEKLLGKKPRPDEPILCAKTLSRQLGNVTVVCKGPTDIITDGNNVLVCTREGSPRRCGGQGDLLSGSMGTFTHWTYKAVQDGVQHDVLTAYGPTICAAYAACLLTRECSKQAYRNCHRSMTTSDMIDEIQTAFENLYM